MRLPLDILEISLSLNVPKVSVVMPAYNAASYIREAAESVLGQSYANIELIIVDDGSRDDTVAVAREIAAQDKRVLLIEQANSGKPSIARNNGISRATGDYLSFLDSDDYWLPDRVASLVEGMQSHPNWVAAFHDLQLITHDGQALPGTYLSNAGFPQVASEYVKPLSGQWYECGERFVAFMSLRYAAVHTQSIIIDRNRFDAVTLLFNESFTICEDTDLWIRIAIGGQIGYLDRILSCYRQHPTSITKNGLLVAQEALRFHKYNQQRVAPRLSKRQRAAYNTKIAGFTNQLAYQYYRNGNLSQARTLSLQSFRMHPRWVDLVTAMKTIVPLAWQQFLRKSLMKN